MHDFVGRRHRQASGHLLPQAGHERQGVTRRWLVDGQGRDLGFVDLAGLGYEQGLVSYLCTAGGVSWPEHLLLVGCGGTLLDPYDLGDIGQKEHANIDAMTIGDRKAVSDWSAYEGAGFFTITYRRVVTFEDGKLHLENTITSHSAEAVLEAVVEAVTQGNRNSLVDQRVIDDPTWSQLASYAAGQGGIGSHCDDPIATQTRCQIILSADYGGGYFAIMEQAPYAYGWRVSAVGQQVS